MPLLQDYPQLKVIQSLARKRDTKVYIVGGFLRDYFLNRKRMDFDFAIEKDAIKVARSFARSIKGAFVLLDKEHGCARVVKKINGQPHIFDFADFRAKTFEGDLKHRDFTINTLCLDLTRVDDMTDIEKGLLDYRKGMKDLRTKTIRMTTSGVLKEDPLRILRAYSLKAVLGFTIEPGTLRQIKIDQDLIRKVSYERIRDEFFKILNSDRTAENLIAMDKIGLLETVLPQITVMFNCTQGGYHHLDVWPHSLETVSQLEGVLKELESDNEITEYLAQPIAGDRTRRSLIKLAALLHDIGKPQTKKKEKDRYSFHGHEHVGKAITREVAKMLKLSKQERFILQDLVLFHLRPGYLSNFKKPSPKSIYRYFRDAKEEAASVLILSLADQRSTRGPLSTKEDERHHEKICRSLLKEYFDKRKQTPVERLITGHDLIKKLKLKPSPLFGTILSAVTEQQNLGKIKTKDEALTFAKTFIKGAT